MRYSFVRGQFENSNRNACSVTTKMAARQLNGRFTSAGHFRSAAPARAPAPCSIPTTPSSTTPTVIRGRRIVDLDYIIRQLLAGCKCGENLALTCCTNETRKGLASLLNVKCASCDALNEIHTSKMHTPKVDDVGTPQRLYPVYDVNTKAALGKFTGYK